MADDDNGFDGAAELVAFAAVDGVAAPGAFTWEIEEGAGETVIGSLPLSANASDSPYAVSG